MLCAVAVGRYWHGRDGQGGRSRGRGGGRTRPRPLDSRRGVSPPGRWSKGPAGPKAAVHSRGCSTSCCCCTLACPGGVAVPRRLHRQGHRRARRGRGGLGRARGLDRVSPLCRIPLKESAGRRPSRQQGLLRSPCRPRWVRRRPKRIVVGCRQSLPAAGAAIKGGDGCRNTSDESPRRSRKVVNPHMWPVCAKTVSYTHLTLPTILLV